MKGDFSRSSFSPGKRYTSVRMQQGRVQLDSDWNEQADILRYAIAAQARDLVGAGAGPDESAGFALDLATRTVDGAERLDLTIGPGCYYVDGLRCDNDAPLWYSEQPGAAGDALPVDAAEGSRVLAYLDVFERLVTALEDPELREPALGGPDTAARTRTTWQVRLLPLAGQAAEGGDPGWAREWQSFVESRACKGRLVVRFDGYGAALGNHLYRVEIHGVDGAEASFKWSRENGAVAFPIARVTFLNTSGSGNTESVVSEGRLELSCGLLERDRLALVEGDLVELEDDLTAIGAAHSLLARVVEVRLEPGEGDQIGTIVGRVKLSADAADVAALRERWQPRQSGPGESPPYARLHPLLRRWDRNGAAAGDPGWKPQPIARDGDTWYPLEHGLAVRFEGQYAYAPGDYWQIVARADAPPGELPARPPDGVERRCAPLALLSRRAGAWHVEDLRRRYRSLPQLDVDLDGERRRLDGATSELARLRAELDELLDELGYLRRKVKDVRGRLHYDYRSDDQLELGAVVAVDPAREGYVVKTERANETLAIGVVGEILSDHGHPIYRVVIYGRAPCKVVGEVAPGDLLVVASEEGYACRGGIFLRPGAVIGKALAASVPDEAGATGVVDAMVTLA